MRVHGAHGGPWPKVVVGPLLLVALVALGCGDICCGPGPEPPDVLTLDEAVPLFAGSYIALYPVRLEAGDDTVMTVVACPTAGQVRVTGRVSETSMGDTLMVEEDITLAPAGCQFSEGGHRFTVDGHPGVRTHAVTRAYPGTRRLEGTITGRLDWQLEDRSGFCEIELEITHDLSGSEWSEGLSGTLCGHAWEFAAGPGS